MAAKTVTVGSAIGLHARPAAIIAEAVVDAGVPVSLSMDGGEPVDAGSALMIMTLGAGNGAQVTVHSDDDETLKKIAELVEADLDA
ncbi:HPr family phosphocarrier protein [Mycolicibacterium sp. 120270]|uniref:HPr family phosphocarrier protein n=1 Tax=Mycolicibacterium sp. 120270 TaxID=3090600 RepID=UPI00299D4D41|nr:HPr family phosphocarrier protein [Mycolicibacterium sp. 120270]MDX1885221.1 HPr family phosphocarrier protein [Mycolicibacterium sp. 120270]